jgi:hypothetical protein
MTDPGAGSRRGGEEQSWSARARRAKARLATLHSALRIGLRRWRELSEPNQAPPRAPDGLHFAILDPLKDARLRLGDYGGLPHLLFHSRTADVSLF